MYVVNITIADYGPTGQGGQSSCSWSTEQETYFSSYSLSFAPGNSAARDRFGRPVPRQPTTHSPMMVVDGMMGEGKEQVVNSKHSTRFGLENERTDAGRDGRTRRARPNSQARTGTEKFSSSLFSLLPQAGFSNLARLINILL